MRIFVVARRRGRCWGRFEIVFFRLKGKQNEKNLFHLFSYSVARFFSSPLLFYFFHKRVFISLRTRVCERMSFCDVLAPSGMGRNKWKLKVNSWGFRMKNFRQKCGGYNELKCLTNILKCLINWIAHKCVKKRVEYHKKNNGNVLPDPAKNCPLVFKKNYRLYWIDQIFRCKKSWLFSYNSKTTLK